MVDSIANALQGAINNIGEASLGGPQDFRIAVMKAVKLRHHAENVEDERILRRDIPYPEAHYEVFTLEEMGEQVVHKLANLFSNVGSRIDEFLKPNQFKFRQAMIMLPELVRLDLAVKEAQKYTEEIKSPYLSAVVDLQRCERFLNEKKAAYGITDELIENTLDAFSEAKPAAPSV